MARAAGANKVYFASAAPAVRYPNVYGIDMPSQDDLIATGRTPEEVAKEIGADGLVYQDLADLKQAIHDLNPNINQYEASCFDGKYVTGDIDEAYLKRLHDTRHQENSNTEPQGGLQFNMGYAANNGSNY